MAITLAVVAVVAWRWWHNHPPYGPEALVIESSLRFVSYEEAQAALGEETHAPLASGRDQLVLGRVSWQAPPKPLDGGYFAIFLIDKRTKHKPGTFGVSAPGEEAVSVGTAGVENKIAQRYPWLEGAGYIKVGETGGRTNGNRLGVTDENASPLTFVARFPYPENPGRETIATAPVAMSDLLLSLVYMGPDGQVYWAQRLQG
ncbi:hypothetical protein NCC78_03300 [Micromonospora phytophila]|uniref:hypothetical protein n=1 Tax=Micromonospora phytophila TaxID=709888 RepID=UPI0020308592|nr:hypothetical protein [Micromonospora phytophila]MCM0673737.1 hypothetical protein [Micromonospora phytophila]